MSALRTATVTATTSTDAIPDAREASRLFGARTAITLSAAHQAPHFKLSEEASFFKNYGDEATLTCWAGYFPFQYSDGEDVFHEVIGAMMGSAW